MNTYRKYLPMLFGAILVALGLIFLVGQVLNIDLGDKLWPLAVIGAGALCFVPMVTGGPAAGRWAIPGSIIVTIGLILLVQNTFDYYESWAYAWALLMAASGVGMIIQGAWSNSEVTRRHGWETARLGIILFLVFGAFFELFIYHNALEAGILGPVILILAGVGLIVYRFIKHPASSKS